MVELAPSVEGQGVAVEWDSPGMILYVLAFGRYRSLTQASPYAGRYRSRSGRGSHRSLGMSGWFRTNGLLDAFSWRSPTVPGLAVGQALPERSEGSNSPD